MYIRVAICLNAALLKFNIALTQDCALSVHVNVVLFIQFGEVDVKDTISRHITGFNYACLQFLPALMISSFEIYIFVHACLTLKFSYQMRFKALLFQKYVC